MFPRQLLHKELRNVFLSATVLGSFATLLSQSASNDGANTSSSATTRSNNPSSVATAAATAAGLTNHPSVYNDFFPSVPLKSSITNFAHCEPKQAHRTPLTTKIGSYFYAANAPIEDRHVYGQHEKWTYSAVFDGHGGHQIADFASQKLLGKVFNHLQGIDHHDELAIDEKITTAFNEMETEILDLIRPSFAVGFGDVAKVGSCVLLALRAEKKLVIANCGDCRAVMGSISQNIYEKEQNPSCFPVRINRDHNCRVPLEQTNLLKNHPGENNLIVCKSAHACYVKGRLQLTRSLGDAYLKYPEFNGNPALGKSGGRRIPDPYTPPYVSHQPDIHHINLEKEDRFLILGSDGLWDYLPDQEAVEIVWKGINSNESEAHIAERLVNRALEIAASECGMTLHQLKELAPGRNRRGRHDDTTAVVMYL